MRHLPDGRYLCGGCGVVLALGDRSLPSAGNRNANCLTCQSAQKTQRRYDTPILNRLPPATHATLRRAAQARRRLEELADLRSVDFSNS